jgi:homoserine kinase
VRVPATSANLGPGFDSFGLALARFDEFEAERIPDGIEVDISGVCADELPRDASHLVVRAAHAGFADVGIDPPGMRLTCRNTIPHGSGQGSSAAAIVAGVLLARALLPPEVTQPDIDWVLDVATRLEGHPDNVAPALFGGFTVAWMADDRVGTPRARAVRIPVHPDISAVLFTADAACATSTARALLPRSVPHADAVANSAAAALLVHAMERDPSLLFDATRDWLHQRYRAEVMPGSLALIDALRARGIAAVLSGAGPSVLALTSRSLDPDVVQHTGFTADVVAIAGEAAGVEAIHR